MDSYLKCIVCDKLLKPRQSFRITLYLRVEMITAIQCELVTMSPYTPQINENTVFCLYHMPQLVTRVAVKIQYKIIWPNRFIADVLLQALE